MGAQAPIRKRGECVPVGIEVEIGKFVGDVAKGIGDTASAAGKGVTEAANAVGGAVSGAVNAAGSALGSVMPGGETSPITEAQIEELLGVCYEKAIGGIPAVSRPIEELVDDYASKYSSIEDAARAMVNMQLVKNATSGFLSGAAGFFALPVTIAAIPANIANVLYVQLRMVAALAAMGGYDVKTDQVQTMVYVCIAGSAATDILKDAGIKAAGKFAKSAIQQIPRATLTRINQAVGFRLVTKFGETGIVNLGKLIPLAGGVIGGAFDFSTTKIIANVAYDHFIGNGTGDVVDEETVETIEESIVCNGQECSDG